MTSTAPSTKRLESSTPSETAIRWPTTELLLSLGEGRRVRYCWTTGNGGRIVTRHVRDQKAHHLGWVRRGGKPATLDRRKVLTDNVHLGDVGAAGEERPVHRLLVLQRQSWCRQRQQG